MKKQEELTKRCHVMNKQVSPIICSVCDCDGCSASEAAKENNAGVCS